MRNCKKLFYVIFIINGFCTSMAQVQVRAKGFVFSKEHHLPVIGATIVLRGTIDSTLIAYTFTNQQGAFSLEKEGLSIKSFSIEVSHISFISEQLVITPEASGQIKGPDQITFFLSPKITPLKSIVINAHAQSIVIKNDTVEYNAKIFKTPEVRKVEDLIKNLPGFSVDATGTITYNGRQVEKMLIEGEDLAGRSYKLISKNLDAAFVNKVQVLKNYSDDRLLVEVENSNKIAVNLTIMNDFKDKISMGVDIGLAKEGKQDLGQNAIYISKGIKLLSLLHYNNTGTMSQKEVAYYYQKDENGSEGLNEAGLSDGIITSSLINPPDLQESYKNDNNNLNTAIMASWKLGSSVKMKYFSGYTTSRLRNVAESVTETTLSAIEKWMLKTNQSANYSENSIINRITLHHDHAGNNVGSFDLDLLSSNQNNKFNEISLGDVQDTRQEQLNNKFRSFHFYGAETFKIASKSVIKLDFNLNKEMRDQNFSLVTNRFLGFFSVDSSYVKNNEILSYSPHQTDLTLRYISKLKKLSYSLGCQISSDRNNYTNQIALYSSNPAKPTIHYPWNQFKPEMVKYSIFGIANIKIGKNNQLSLGGTVGQSALSLIKDQRQQLAYFKSIVVYKKDITEFKSIGFQYSLKREIPNLDNYTPNDLISGNMSVIQPASVVESWLLKEANIYYVNHNVLQNSQFFASATCRKSSKEYTMSSFLFPEYVIYANTPSKNNTQLVGLLNQEKYIDPIKSKIVWQFQGSVFKRFLLINQNWKENVSSLASMQLKFLSSLKLPINLELSTRIQYFKNRFVNDTIGSNHYWQFQHTLNTKIVFSKHLYSSISYKHYSLSETIKFDAVECYMLFKLKAHATFSITVHNLFNASAFTQKNLSPAVLSINSFQVVPRYVLGKLSLLF